MYMNSLKHLVVFRLIKYHYLSLCILWQFWKFEIVKIWFAR